MRGYSALAAALAMVSLGACGLENRPPPDQMSDSGRTGDDRQAQTTQVVERPILQPTESEGRICTDYGAVIGVAQPGSTVIAQGPAGPATAQASSSDGRFCIAVPLAKGQQNRIEVYSQHAELGTSQTAVTTLTHAGLDCPTNQAPLAEPASAQDEQPQPAEVIQVRASATAQSGADRAMVDGDKSTSASYEVFNWKIWEGRSDEMWIWLTLASVKQIQQLRVYWTDSIGHGKRYATKYYLAVSSAEAPGEPPIPPVSGIFGSEPASSQSEWTYLARQAQTNSSGGTETIDLSAELPAAQHIALWLEADADWLTFAEEFSIAEIEVIPTAPQTSAYYPTASQSTVCGSYL